MTLLLVLSTLASMSSLAVPAAVAAICVTCEDEPHLPGAPTARYVVSQPMDGFGPGHGAYNLSGYDAEDSTGYDEAYFKINGNTVWGPHTVAAGPFPAMGNGYHQVHFSYSFYTGLTQSPSFYISMFDEDFPDPDDKLGGHQVTLPPLSVGGTTVRELTFNIKAHYVLRIQVTRVA